MKIHIILLLLVGLLMASCDQDNEGAIYQSDKTVASFLSPTVVGLEMTAENDYAVYCKVVRTDDQGVLTVPVSLEITKDIEGLFELEAAEVSFAEGESEAYVKIVPLVEPSELDPAKKYEFNLTLEGDNATPFTKEATFIAALKIDFVEAGVSLFTSEAFGGAWEVEVMKAELGNVIIYKLLDLYEAGFPIEIIVKGTDVTVAGQAAWLHGTYGKIFVGGAGSSDGTKLTMKIEHYVPGLGSFGEFTEVFTLP